MSQKENKVYEIKIYPQFYNAITSGNKTFELRKCDKDYQIGDILKFREFDKNEYTGHSTLRRISYIQKGNDKFGLDSEYCILAFKKIK